MRTAHPRTPAAPSALLAGRAAAREAGLRYVADTQPGISRSGAGNTFRYFDASGRRVADRATLARIRRLAIPPAWTQVWICPAADGHIQATGRDARGRKQYRYHPEWATVRDGAKFERLIAFGRALPRIRKQVASDLRRRSLDREKVLAAMVRLLETTAVRIGNEEYARQNHSFGLTTLRNRHVRIGRGVVHFEFRGKSGKNHAIDLHDPRLASLVHRLQELPGQDLFQYLDETDRPQKITSADVNEYLRAIAGDEFSAKDFRTWTGTVLAGEALAAAEPFTTRAAAKTTLKAAVEQVAARLRNTVAVCRKCYIHPAILEGYSRGAVVRKAAIGVTARWGLSPSEKEVLRLLQRVSPPLLSRLEASVRAQGGAKRPATGGGRARGRR